MSHVATAPHVAEGPSGAEARLLEQTWLLLGDVLDALAQRTTGAAALDAESKIRKLRSDIAATLAAAPRSARQAL